MGEAAAKRAAQPDRIVRDVTDDPRQQRAGRIWRYRAVERRMAHAGADRKHAVGDREAIETGYPIDVDEMGRPRHAKRHHRDEALTAGEHAAILRAEFSEVRQRVIDRLRRVIGERRWFHRARPLAVTLVRPYAKQPSPALVNAGLRRAVGPTDEPRDEPKRQCGAMRVRLTG